MFSPVTAAMCEPMLKLISVKADWMWNRMHQDLYDRAEKIIKKDACMKFCDTSRPLYLENNALGVSLGATLLQVRVEMNYGHGRVSDNATLCPIAFASKSLLSAEHCFSNIE